MSTYIIRRLIQAIAVCLVISAISFFLLFLNTDPALVLLPPEVEMQDIELFKKQMGILSIYNSQMIERSDYHPSSFDLRRSSVVIRGYIIFQQI